MEGGEVFVGPPDDPNRYRLGNPVGLGGEGEVYEATALFRDGPAAVAIKVWRTPDADDPQFERMAAAWKDQLDLVQSIAHSGIVRMRTVFVGAPPHFDDQPSREGRALYLVMNWAPGVALTAWVRSHPNRTYADVSRIITAVSSAVTHLHSGRDTAGQAIVHCDIKPGNVMMADDGRIQIVDFGLARGERRAPGFGHTPGYAAPEVVRSGAFSVRSDLYSLAALAFFLIVGHNPPERYDFDSMSTALIEAPLTAGQPEIVDHICSALVADPNARPADVATWASGFEGTTSSAVTERLPPPAPSGPASSELSGPAHTHPGRSGLPIPLVLLGALALVAGLAAALFVTRPGGRDASARPDDSTSVSSAPPVTTVGVPSTTSPTVLAAGPSIGTSSGTRLSITTTSTRVATTQPPRTATTLAPAVPVFLDELDVANRDVVSLYEKPVKIAGTTYPHSVLFEAFSSCCPQSVEYDIGGEFAHFTATIGLASTSQYADPFTFEVFGDGERLYDGTVGPTSPQTLNLDVSGRQRLKIQTLPPSSPHGCCWSAGWGDAQLTP